MPPQAAYSIQSLHAMVQLAKDKRMMEYSRMIALISAYPITDKVGGKHT